MTRLTSQETVDAKRAFEHFAKQHGVRVLHYHCDNGWFADNDIKNACASANQRLTFCGVNAHFQNGIAKKAIHYLRGSASKQLLHARHGWPAAIHLALWPYTLRYMAYLHPSQHSACSGRRHIQTHDFQLNPSRDEIKTLAHIWMPCVCPAEQAILWWPDSSLVPTSMTTIYRGLRIS